jgi:uncharacterized membrane protein
MIYNVFCKTTYKGGLLAVRFESSIDINAPAGKVWAMMGKLEEWPQWMPSIKKIERVSKGLFSVGSRFSVTVKVRGLTVELSMMTTKFVPERTVVLEGEVLGSKLVRFYTLEPVDGKTKVTIGGDVSGVLAWLVRWGGQKVSAEIALAAKTRIEGSE